MIQHPNAEGEQKQRVLALVEKKETKTIAKHHADIVA
jgi:hypothetical protein